MKQLINRMVNIMLSPSKEWGAIVAENHSHIKVLRDYLLVVAVIPTFFVMASHLGVMHRFSLSGAAKSALFCYVLTIVSVYMLAMFINYMAQSSGAVKNFNRAFQLAAYSYTAVCFAGVFKIHWGLSLLEMLVAIYCLYILYCGLERMMNVARKTKRYYFGIIVLFTVCLWAAMRLLSGVLMLLF